MGPVGISGGMVCPCSLRCLGCLFCSVSLCAASGNALPSRPDHAAEPSAIGAQHPAPSWRGISTYRRYVTETLQGCYRTTRRLLHGISGGPHRTSGARSSGVTGVACRVTMRADCWREPGDARIAAQRVRYLVRRSAHVEVLLGAGVSGLHVPDVAPARFVDRPGALDSGSA